jgi:large subunit ribosomal protein L4
MYLPPEGVNLYDVLRHPHLVLTKDAVAALQTRLQKA